MSEKATMIANFTRSQLNECFKAACELTGNKFQKVSDGVWDILKERKNDVDLSDFSKYTKFHKALLFFMVSKSLSDVVKEYTDKVFDEEREEDEDDDEEEEMEADEDEDDDDDDEDDDKEVVASIKIFSNGSAKMDACKSDLPEIQYYLSRMVKTIDKYRKV